MGQLKYHNGTTWVPIEDGVSDYSAFVQNEIMVGTINGTNLAFTTTRTFASIAVYVNGVRQTPGAGNDYQVTGSTQITFEAGSAPVTGSIVTADYSTSSSYTVTGTNSFVRKQVVTGTINGTNKIFTTASPYVGGTLEVFVNGVRQAIAHVVETAPGTGTFTFDDAPLTGDNVEVAYMTGGTPSGNADTVDSFHASSTPTPNTIPVLDSAGMLNNLSLNFNSAQSLGGSGSSFVSSSTTYVDVTGMSVSLTIPTGVTKLAVIGSVRVSSQANGVFDMFVRVMVGSTPSLEFINTSTAAFMGGNWSVMDIITVTPGTYTAKVQYKGSSATSAAVFPQSSKILLIPIGA